MLTSASSASGDLLLLPQAMAGSSGISTTSLAKGSGSSLSWRGATPDGNAEVVLQEKPLQRIAVPKVPLIKVLRWHNPQRFAGYDSQHCPRFTRPDLYLCLLALTSVAESTQAVQHKPAFDLLADRRMRC